MADFEDWDADTDIDGSGDDGTPTVQGGLLDPATFPSPWSPPVADAAALERPAPGISGPLDTDVHAEVLRDIQNAQDNLPPIDRPAAAITGPLMTDPHAEAFQNFMNAQAGLRPVAPHPETWSINGQPYLAISARTFDPGRSNGVTSMPTPADSAAAVTGKSKVATRDQPPEKVGFISQPPSRVILAKDRAGGGGGADTATFHPPVGLAIIHGHIDGLSDGMVDDTKETGGYGDTESLKYSPSSPTATVSQGRVGWHVLDNGRLKFLYPPGSMTSSQIGLMQQNLDQEQQKFLRTK